MDEYNINNIEKINSINFININNQKISPEEDDPIYNKINYLNSLNKLNSYSTKKNKKTFKSNNKDKNNLLLQDKYIEASLKYMPRYNHEEISSDYYEMNRTNISDMNQNSRKYEGLQNKKSNQIISDINKTKQNFSKPIDKMLINNTYNKILIRKYKSKNEIKNKNNIYNNNEIDNNTNNNQINKNKITYNQRNNNLNSFTDVSVDESNEFQSTQNNLYIKRINEFKNRNRQLIEKINLYINSLKLKTNEVQNLKQKNQELQNELYLLKVNNEQNKNNNNINNNEELKKVLMQKNKIIKDVYQKMQAMKKEMETKNLKNSNLSKILTKKNLELVGHQKELIEKDKKIEELNLALNEEKNNINKKNEELNKINKELKDDIDEKEKQIETLSKKINDLEIDLKGVKHDAKEYFFFFIKNKEIIEQKDKEIKELNQQILKNNKKYDLIFNKENKDKESEILLKRIEELTNENNKLTNHINTLTSKNSIISPNNYIIITTKHHKKLLWYLLFKKSSSPKEKKDSKDYNNYIWVKESDIKKEDLKNFNKFEEEKNKINEYKEYIVELQKKLELKEEKINKLDYKNQKLSSQLHNKTANIKGNNISLTKQGKDNSNFVNSFNTEAAENEKYKHLLDKLNDSNKRNIHLHNQVVILKEKLNEKNNLEKKFPHDMKDIDPKLIDSGFLDDDSFENKEREINDLFYKNEQNDLDKNININNIKENKIENNLSNNDDLNKAINYDNLNNDDPFKESERKVDEFLAKGAGEEDDFDEVKMINKQMNFLKEEIKDNREKNKKLGDEIKELFSKIKCNDKNRKHIVQICQILAFPPVIIDQIISNKYKIDKTNK